MPVSVDRGLTDAHQNIHPRLRKVCRSDGPSTRNAQRVIDVRYKGRTYAETEGDEEHPSGPAARRMVK